MYVALVLTAAVVITLWRRSLHRTGVMLGVLGVVLCAAGGVWLLVRATAAMPRPIAEQPGLQNDIAVRLVAATEHWALFAKPDFTLVRVSLPGGAIVGTYDFGDEDVAFLRAAAIGDDALALTYVANTGDATENFWDAWALLGADGWRVAPGSRTEPAFAATWEPQSHTFLFTSEGRLASGAAGEEDVTEFSNLRVDPTGADVSRSVLHVLGAPQVTHVCYVDGLPYGSGLLGTEPCRITDSGHCEALPLPDALAHGAGPGRGHPGFVCPEIAIETGWSSGLITSTGLRSIVAPPGSEGAQVSESHVQQLPDGSLQPRLGWITADLHNVVAVGDDFLFIGYLDDGAASRLGHVVGEMQVTLVDADGNERGRSYLSQFSGPHVYALVSGDEIVALSPGLDERARFDRHDLTRLDAPGTVDAVHARLSRWGGRSVLFESVLLASLASPALVFPLALIAWWKRETRFGKTFTAQRIGLSYLMLALPTLAAAFIRLFHI